MAHSYLNYKSCLSVKLSTLLDGSKRYSICSELGSLDGETDVLGNARSVLSVDLEQVGNETFLDVSAALAESTGNVVDNTLALGVVEDIAEEATGLLVVVVGVVVGVAADLTVVVGSVPGSGGVGDGTVSRVGVVVDLTLLVAVGAHRTVTDHVRYAGTVGAVDGDLLVVGSESMSVGVGVGEETSLEHLVKRCFDSGNQVRGREGGLLGLGMEVLGVTVEDESADINQGVVTVGPDFGHVVDVKSVLVSVGDGHNLDLQVPGGEVSISDVVVEIVGSEILIGGDLSGSLLRGEALNSLVGFEVFLDEEFFTFLVDPLESVGRVAVHVSEAVGSSTVGHEDGHLMEGLGSVGPVVELHVGVVGSLDGARLLRVDEVGELDGVFDKENRGVVSDHVVVAFFSVELNRKPTGVSHGIRSTSFSSDGGETEEAGGALTDSS